MMLRKALLFTILLIPNFGYANCDSLFGVELIDCRNELAEIQSSADSIRQKLNHSDHVNPEKGLYLRLDAQKPNFAKIHLIFGSEAPVVERFIQRTVAKLTRKFQDKYKKEPKKLEIGIRTEEWEPFFNGYHRHGSMEELTSTFTVVGDGTALAPLPDRVVRVYNGEIDRKEFSGEKSVPAGFAPVIDGWTFHAVPMSSFRPKPWRPKRLMFLVDLE